MNEKFYNNNLFEVVKIAFRLLDVTSPIIGSFKEKDVTLNGYKLNLNISDFDKYNYGYIRLLLVTNHHDECYMLWGYVNINLDEFIVDDFTFFKYVNGELDPQNFFRDVINTPEAEEYTAQMLKEIKSL